VTAINHAITGALIGLVIGQPLIALPAAFLSHFVCDAIPHFDPAMPAEQWIRSRTFVRFLLTDASLCVLLVVVLAISQPHHWLLASICAFLATSPDLYWIRRFLLTRSGRMWKPNLFERFAANIQWYTSPRAAIVEFIWFTIGMILLVPRLHV
jgi:hypothetical protein